MSPSPRPWWLRQRWLILRRLSQLGILALFLAGPLLGVWWVKGNLTSSLTLDVLPLTDPFIQLQALVAGFWPSTQAWLGAAIVLGFYALIGGRVFCAWVCPVNLVTDLAAWLRTRLGIRLHTDLARSARYWILGFVLLFGALSGTIIWEWVNPVSMLHRGLIYGFGLAWALVLLVLLFDLFITQRGWCGHLCPMGAFYSLLGRFSLLRVGAPRRQACNDCMDCYHVCPESQVLRPVLKGEGRQPAVITDMNCNNCGRCIDVCDQRVFEFSHRFQK